MTRRFFFAWVMMLALCLSAGPALAAKAAPRAEQATLGGGCFWCLDAVFRELKGVSKVESGYAGGHVPSPSYEQVCRGDTGHAEVVQLTFDPGVVSYRDLLAIFFTAHDPTTLNQQGADKGTQYRSIILTHSAAQAKTARSVIQELSAARYFDKPITTEIKPLGAFHVAEAYHQNYFAKNPNQPYCVFVVGPKLEKFRKQHLARLKR